MADRLDDAQFATLLHALDLGRSTGWRSRRDSPRIDEVNQRLRERLRVVDELLRVRIDALVSAIGDGLFASQRRSHGTHLQQRLSWNR